MFRHVMIGLAAATLVGAMLVPDDAAARGGRGGGARVSAGGGARIAGNRAHISHPIARPGVGYCRYGYRGVGWGVGAVAAGAAAAGYYGNSGYGYGDYNNCYRDSYGQLICPNQYQYQYPNQYQYRY
jgi:hypothetical protein